ncbi:MAG: hypothetical protein DMD74_04385 [Gemmatimonadetes bacterium]|nr:MAG: hypothetical protein DMD74_04385 [Gemmatimonadota bacterium]
MIAIGLVLAVAGVAGAGAQATGTTTFNAPYRAFTRAEFGAFLSFPNGGGTAFEGVYRMASGKFDIGFKGGLFDPSGPGKSVLYVQPTGFFLAGNGSSDFQFALGLGVDLRLSRVFDARISAGLGDVRGVSIGAVWVH